MSIDFLNTSQHSEDKNHNKLRIQELLITLKRNKKLSHFNYSFYHNLFLHLKLSLEVLNTQFYVYLST